MPGTGLSFVPGNQGKDFKIIDSPALQNAVDFAGLAAVIFRALLDCSALAPCCLKRASASFQEVRGQILKLSIVLPCKNAVNVCSFGGRASRPVRRRHSLSAVGVRQLRLPSSSTPIRQPLRTVARQHSGPRGQSGQRGKTSPPGRGGAPLPAECGARGPRRPAGRPDVLITDSLPCRRARPPSALGLSYLQKRQNREQGA